MFADPDTAGALADIVFTEDLPPLDLTASDMTVFGTHGVKLPTQAELESAHLYNRLGVEKLFGQAFYLLIAKYAHEVCFSDPSRPAVFAVDETWRVTLVRGGRGDRARVHPRRPQGQGDASCSAPTTPRSTSAARPCPG